MMEFAASKNIPFWLRFGIFLSSISLLFLAVSVGCSIKFISETCFAGSDNGGWNWSGGWQWGYVGFLFLGIVTPLIPLRIIWINKTRSPKRGRVTQIEDTSHQAVAHAVLYLSLFIAQDCSLDNYVWLFVFVLITGLIYCQTNIFSLNPILILFGYRYYDVRIKFPEAEYPLKYLIISKADLDLDESIIINCWSTQPIAIYRGEK